MVIKAMEITLHIEKPLEDKSFFITGKLNFDFNYFIEKIEEGIKQEDNNNYKTNIIGSMTNYKFFLNDPYFQKISMNFIKYFDENLNLPAYKMEDAWGYKVGIFEYTKSHNHRGYCWSGALYLNSHTQTLDFPQFNKKIKPEPGRFVLFPSWIKHECLRQIDEKNPKYGLSFNARFV